MHFICFVYLVFASHGVSLDRPVIATCGSGMTACWIALAAEAADNQEIPVYVVSQPWNCSIFLLSSRQNLLILFIKLLIVRVLQGSWLEWYARGPTESKTIGVKGEDL